MGISVKREKITWSPLEGASPEPRQRSKALMPPEFGSSEKSETVEDDEAGASKERSEEHVEMKERDKASLLVVDEEDDDGEEG
ncbi:hypothetical protein TorRG33x02_005180 [Trema orientale]|uniref:Uncharacterized protein n=1 Tax=Trema orientale TaxID=63057 RepID=A0A2P5FZT5_TREOI|nr:hypothetical protein TorRG33x02_005180 [Trema orientale]